MKLYTYDYLKAGVVKGIILSYNNQDKLGIEVGDSFVNCVEGFNPTVNDHGLILECGVKKIYKAGDNTEFILTQVDASQTFEMLGGVLVLLNTFTTHKSRMGGWVSLGKEKPIPRVIAFGTPSTNDYSVCYLLVLPNSSTLKFQIQCETVIQTMRNDNGNIIVST
jgi:hypothetical protein